MMKQLRLTKNALMTVIVLMLGTRKEMLKRGTTKWQLTRCLMRRFILTVGLEITTRQARRWRSLAIIEN